MNDDGGDDADEDHEEQFECDLINPILPLINQQIICKGFCSAEPTSPFSDLIIFHPFLSLYVYNLTFSEEN